MRLMPFALAIALLAGTAPAEQPVVPYDSLMDDRVSIDGWVDREDGEFEYPAELKNPATGMTVSWGFDDSLIYVALETRGRGWFGVGFGTAGMDESNMLVGYYTEDSVDLYNLVGRDHGHAVAGHADSLALDWDIDFDDETGVAAIEFSYPLTWRGEGAPPALAENSVLKESAIPGLAAGDVFDLILAQNTKSISLRERHSHRATLKFQLAEAPAAGEGE